MSMNERGRPIGEEDATSANAAQNLTGVWNGLYTYPDGQSVSFVATLIESGSTLTGSTHEPSMGGGAPGTTLTATLLGSRQDSAVSFRKTYDGAIAAYRSVDYVGQLSADATEIEGRWVILGVWSGKFLMIRSSGKRASAEYSLYEQI
jgi:hypothetical protein